MSSPLAVRAVNSYPSAGVATIVSSVPLGTAVRLSAPVTVRVPSPSLESVTIYVIGSSPSYRLPFRSWALQFLALAMATSLLRHFPGMKIPCARPVRSDRVLTSCVILSPSIGLREQRRRLRLRLCDTSRLVSWFLSRSTSCRLRHWDKSMSVSRLLETYKKFKARACDKSRVSSWLL